MAAVPWVVNAGDRLRYEALFKQTDSDKDGYVSGVEIKNLLLQTGLPQNILAHIWNLCDMRQEGKRWNFEADNHDKAHMHLLPLATVKA